jgi:hypothetical protein
MTGWANRSTNNIFCSDRAFRSGDSMIPEWSKIFEQDHASKEIDPISFSLKSPERAANVPIGYRGKDTDLRERRIIALVIQPSNWLSIT